jgi:TonB-dependent SusC/RagA subfamily outer membrane receptor
MRSTFFLTASLVFGLMAAAQKPVEQKTETRVIIQDGSFNGEKPLVLVDGKVVADINSVTPDRIASMDVLKGSSATALYGTEGKNGVIVITTKSAGKADTVTPGTRKVERRVMVNTFRTSDGSKDTTIIRADSVTMKVEVDGGKIMIEGMPLEEFRDRGGKEMDVRVFRMGQGPNEERREIRIENDRRAFLGVATEKSETGALVKEVVSGSPAEKAGLLAEDRIVSVDGQKVDGPESLIKIIGAHQPGDKVVVAWTRGKKSMKSTIELDKPQAPKIVEGFRLPNMPDMPEGELREFELAMPRIMMDAADNRKVFLFKNDESSPFGKSAPKIGLSVQDTEEGKGVQVLSVLPTSAAAKAGIQANDRIVSIDQTAVNDVDGLKRAIENTSSKRSVMVHVQREKKEMHIELVYPRELKKADL